jgi:HK97 family phage major capsid protein
MTYPTQTLSLPRAGLPEAEVNQTLKVLSQSFDDFKTSNTDKIKAVDKAAQARMDELETLFSHPLAGGTQAPGALNDQTALKNFFAAVQRKAPDDAIVDVSAAAEYQDAFPEYLRRGDAASNEVRAVMQVGSDPDGGYWTPPQMAQDIKSRLFETSPMRELASIDTMATDSLELPIDTNDATSGGWIGETASRPETATPEIGLQTIYMREQYAMPIVTQKLLDDSAFNIDKWLVDKITNKLVRTENTAFVTGAGVSAPRGFLDYSGAAVTTADATRAWGVLQYVFTGASGGFPALSGVASASDADALIDTVLALKPEYLPNAVWAMARSTAGVIRKLKDGDGRHLWIDNIAEGGAPLLLGHPVRFLEDMPAISANSFSVAFGDFNSGYGIYDHAAGVRILRDPYTTKGKVKFYVTKRVAGDCRDFDAIKLLKFGTA